MPINKEKILEEIRRTAKENGGVPLGIDRFTKETGISTWEIGKYWARFGDAQQEAGFSPNQKTIAYDEELLLNSIIDLIRELGQFPTRGEMRLKRFKQPDFPPDTVYYRRFGSKKSLGEKISEYAARKGYNDIVKFVSRLLKALNRNKKRMKALVYLSARFIFLNLVATTKLVRQTMPSVVVQNYESSCQRKSI